MRPGLLAVITLLVTMLGISTWLAAAEYPTVPIHGDFHERTSPDRVLTGPDASERRRDALRRAILRVPPAYADHLNSPIADAMNTPVPSCRFLPSQPSGTTPKFECVFAGGDTVKVKYGQNAEIHAEAAATRLLRMLGYGADTVIIVPRLRCYGCPRHPFVAARLRSLHFPLVADGVQTGYTDFEWVSIERKFPAPAIQTGTISGWDWRELDEMSAPHAEVDAFRLLAVFLAHWDNKPENQRLVCLDPGPERSGECQQPLAMIQDLGATFGPSKVNLARWSDLPVWHDRTSCTVSMRALPFAGATFEDAQISEAGRALAAERLRRIADADIERLFTDARFPQFQAGTADERDLRAWTAAFTSRVRQIDEARCP